MADSVAPTSDAHRSHRQLTNPVDDAWADPFLATKLHLPQVRSDLVHRLRLVQRLEDGLQTGRKLSLMSAPAGFGKTTLLAEWLEHRRDAAPGPPAAWVSLDEADNDPARFLAYLAVALRTLDLPIRAGLVEALFSSHPPPIAPVLANLVNSIARSSWIEAGGSPAILILDDYHVIKARAVHDAVAFLLEHLPEPPQGPHLVIASRSDPPLHLARLRGRGLLTELRLVDLRFTPDEAVALFRDVAGLPLSVQDVAALEARTEGWITGLQLAAIALQAAISTTGEAGRRDAAPAEAAGVSRFIQEFTGSHRFVLDYLVEEVLLQQPLHIQRFLLQTSILERLTGSLCDAVCLTGAQTDGVWPDGQSTLETLEQANLFIVPLDSERRWYRYHRLFADLLRSRLDRLGPELGCAPSGELHLRASLWYEDQGFLAGAIAHALAAKDHERAAGLAEGHGLQMLKRGEMTALLGWLEALPTDVIRSRPRLCIYQAWALALSGQLDGVEASLQAAESAPEASRQDDRAGQIAAIRAYVAAQGGEMARAVELAHRALALLDEDNLVVRSVVAFTLGGIYLFSGDRAAAAGALTQATEMGQAAGNVHLAVPASTLLADLEVQRGRLHKAFEAYQAALEVAGHSPVAAQAHSGLGQVLYEWNDLDSAAHHLAQGVELGRMWGNIDALSGDYVVLAWIRWAQGDRPGAFQAQQEAEQLIEGKDLHPIAAAEVIAGRVKLAIAAGDLAVVQRWVRDCGLDLEGDIVPQREVEYVTLARALLALGQAEAACQVVDRLLANAEKDGRLGRSIEFLVLQALAHRAQGALEQARAALARALTYALPEGYIRTFLDEGEPLHSLLSDLRSRLLDRAVEDAGRLLAYTGDLLVAFAPAGPRATQLPDGDQARVPNAGLVEPLSERELEVLRLVADGLTNQAIADKLFIAVSTVKSHTNSIYGKLDVRNRTQAVAQARALGLL